MKTLKQIREASGGKEAYMKFFNSLLKKHGVSSPSELKGDKKKAFFNALDKGWESDDPNDKNETYTDPDNLDPDTTLNPDEDDEDDLDEVHNGNADDESPKKKVDDNEGNYSGVDEKAPPGMEDVVKKLKQDHSDEEAFAIAWSIYNKKETEAE